MSYLLKIRTFGPNLLRLTTSTKIWKSSQSVKKTGDKKSGDMTTYHQKANKYVKSPISVVAQVVKDISTLNGDTVMILINPRGVIKL